MERRQLTNAINSYLNNPEKAVQISKKLATPLKDEIEQLNRRIQSIDGEIDNYLRKAANPKTSSAIALRYEENADKLMATKSNIQSEIVKLQDQLKILTSLSADNGFNLSTEQIFCSNDVSRSIIHRLVKRIEIDDKTDKISITFA